MDGELTAAREKAMRRLRDAERERSAAIDELRALGVVRSRVLVGDLGEEVAAKHYGVDLAAAFTPGFDLTDKEGRRVQVKTLRGTPRAPRTIIGPIADGCDVVFVVRLNYDFTPREAIEIPVEVVREYVAPNGKLNWTNRLVEDTRVEYFSASELGYVDPDAEATVRLIGPALEVVRPGGEVRELMPLDTDYLHYWSRLPQYEQNWHPSWGFFPGDDRVDYPPDAAF